MSRTISIANKPQGYGAASNRPQGHGAASNSRSHSRSHNPKIAENIVWRRDGEADQLIIVSREDLPLPLILNPTAAIIFSLCDGRHSVENIAERLCQEFGLDDLSRPEGHGAASNSRSHIALEDVKKQIEYFKDKCIVKV